MNKEKNVEREKKGREEKQKKEGGVQMLRGQGVKQQQRILENDYDYNFQHQKCRVGLPWDLFLSNCYFGGCGDRFLSLVREV